MPKRGNGNDHGNGKDPVVAGLDAVVAELRGLRDDTNARFESVEQVLRGHTRQLGEVVDRLGRVETGLADLRGEVHEGFAELGDKIESAADRDRHLETSVQQLGERVARLEARSGEPR
jgi:ABC-type transporter Mla subunit MlaD